MNELVLFYEQTHLTPYSPSVFFDSWSHWGELNPRPSPYQGDAIPLSHSGDMPSIGRADLIATIGLVSFIHQQTQVEIVTREVASRDRIARYCA